MNIKISPVNIDEVRNLTNKKFIFEQPLSDYQLLALKKLTNNANLII
jgi:hypothetical protein